VIKNGRQNNNPMVSHFNNFSNSVLNRLVVIRSSWRGSASHYSLGANGNHKSQMRYSLNLDDPLSPELNF